MPSRSKIVNSGVNERELNRRGTWAYKVPLERRDK
jgi:hypothetical protein